MSSVTFLSIDPGGTPSAAGSRSATGWSLWELPDDAPISVIEHGQVPGNEHRFAPWFRWAMAEYGFDRVVSESFRLDDRTRFPDVTPLKIEGVLAALWGDRVIFQPNTAKSALPDEKAKALGFWWKGQPHSVDSARHAFFYARSIRHIPTMKLLSGRK